HHGCCQTVLDQLPLDPRCRTNRNRRSYHERVSSGGEPGNAHCDIAEVFRAIFGQEDHSNLAGKSLDIRGVGQTAAAHVAPNDLLEIALEKRDAALRHLDHARTVRVATSYRTPVIRHTAGEYCAQVP